MKLRDYQKSAVSAYMKRNGSVLSRAQIIMPCGTGKTIVGLAIFERLSARTVVVLVPSLALIQQTIESWERNRSREFSSLLVCSDADLGSDEVMPDLGEHERTTDPDRISSFIRGRGRRVIVCTYASAEKLKGVRLDLAIFDEAHRTAGHSRKRWGFGLKEADFKAKRRLFMTATPRIVSEDSMEMIERDGRPAYETHKRTMDALRRERAAFDRMRPELVRAHGQGWAVVHGGVLAGVYADVSDAHRVGWERFGLDEPFLVANLDDDGAPRLVPYFTVEPRR